MSSDYDRKKTYLKNTEETSGGIQQKYDMPFGVYYHEK